MSVKNILLPIDMVNVNSNTFDGTYKVLTAGLSQACNYIQLQNECDKDITISLDGGATDHFFLQAGSMLPIYSQMIAIPNSCLAFIAKGTAISVKGAVGTGLIYLSGLYQPVNH